MEGTMIREFDKTIFLRWIDAWNNRDVDTMDHLAEEIFTSDVIQHIPDMPDFPPGIAAQIAFQHELIAKNPVIHFSINDLLFDGDKMILRATFQTINQSTGAEETTVGIEIDRLVGGKIAELWNVSLPGNW
jgi:predicted SnoaL-like aldol condensation-catalyzing enzyme